MNTNDRFELLMQKLEMIWGYRPQIDNAHKPRMVLTERGEWLQKDQVLNTVREVRDAA